MLLSAYIVATVRIKDPERFAVYAKAVAGLSEKYCGELLVRGAVKELLEGEEGLGERVVVTRFETSEAARAYIASAEYQEAKSHREGAADIVMRLIAD